VLATLVGQTYTVVRMHGEEGKERKKEEPFFLGFVRTDTREECAMVLEEDVLTRVLAVLEKGIDTLEKKKEEEKQDREDEDGSLIEKKREEKEVEIALNILVMVAVQLFKDSSKEEHKEYQTRMEKVDGYNRLLSLLEDYKNPYQRQQISIVIGLFYSRRVIPKESEIIIKELSEGLKSPITPSNTTHIHNILLGLISISLNDENNHILIDSGVIPFIIPLIVHNEYNIWINSVVLISNISLVLSSEKKNEIIKTGIFDIIQKKLMEISPPPPSQILPFNYYPLSRICITINNLLFNNSKGIDKFLNSSLLPFIIHTLVSVSFIVTSSFSTPDDDVMNIQRQICECFTCTYYSYDQCVIVVKS
jgi:hypothetical protein